MFVRPHLGFDRSLCCLRPFYCNGPYDVNTKLITIYPMSTYRALQTLAIVGINFKENPTAIYTLHIDPYTSQKKRHIKHPNSKER